LSINRWFNTDAATAFTSSGVTKSRCSSAARAFAERLGVIGLMTWQLWPYLGGK